MFEKLKEIIAEQLSVDEADIELTTLLRMTLELIHLIFLSLLWLLRKSTTARFLLMIYHLS